MNLTEQIARDALEQLELGNLIANNCYVVPELDDDGKKAFLDGHLDVGALHGVPCHVCAKGALLVAYYLRRPEDEQVGHMVDKFAELGEAIGLKQWDLIEACYEGFDRRPDTIPTDFHDRYYHNHERLWAILENIVRNGGTFIPEQDLAVPA